MGAGLRPGAKATDQPPDPNAGAPVSDSTGSRMLRGLLRGTLRGDKQGETAATIRMRRSAPARNGGRA